MEHRSWTEHLASPPNELLRGDPRTRLPVAGETLQPPTPRAAVCDQEAALQPSRQKQRDGVSRMSFEEWEGLPFPEAPLDKPWCHPGIWGPNHHAGLETHRPAASWSQDSGCSCGQDTKAFRGAGSWPGSAAFSGPQGRQVARKVKSWPRRAASHPPSSLPSSRSDPVLHWGVTGGPRSPPRLPEFQRRASLGAGPEKKAWRKIRVYSPDSPADGSFGSLCLDGGRILPGPPFPEDALRVSAAPAPEETERLGLRPTSKGPAPCAGPEALDPVLSQERRRFSALELMSKWQLSQRRRPFSLKLGKSFSGRSATRETAGQQGKPAGKTRSLGSISTRSQGPALELPGHRGCSRNCSEEPEEGQRHEDNMRASREKRSSRFLPNSILYQEYSAAATDRELQRQQREDILAEGGEGEARLPPKSNVSNPSGSFRSSSGCSAFSLWQDIPNVRSSGFLGTIGVQVCKLQEAKFELITSEASYIHSLSIAVQHFMNSRELNECLSAQEKQWLFSKLPEVKDVSKRFLQDLEGRLEEDILRFDVCDIVLRHCPAFRRVYLPYVTNQAYQEQTYQRLLLESPKFPGVLARLEEDPVCQRLPLTSFLILPFQRVTRLKMVVENILKRTLQGSQDEDAATRAFSELKKLVKECNTSVQSMKRTEDLIHLSKKIHFEGKIFPLISQSRWLVKHGGLVEVGIRVPSTSRSKLKLSAKMVHLHLFNDCLLLSRKETGKFAVFVHAKMPELRVTDLSSKLHRVPGQIFLLQLSGDQQLKQQILLQAQSESEKLRWISAIAPSSPQQAKKLMSESEDVAQVQCIKAYKAQDHDELTLEKADILGVRRKTCDGWMEGVRLSDGESGWVPVAHVEEITSRSARLRNLRENNRIKHATWKLEGGPL